jgi:FixJ family two-component response regulator
MSPMDGLELIKNMREAAIKTPVILLTGFADNLGLRTDSTGADVVVQKSANELTNLLRHAKKLLNPPRKPVKKHTAARSNHGTAASS